MRNEILYDSHNREASAIVIIEPHPSGIPTVSYMKHFLLPQSTGMTFICSTTLKIDGFGFLLSINTLKCTKCAL